MKTFASIFSFLCNFFCFPLLLTSTSYPYIKSALPMLCSFFLFLALRAHFRKLASLAYWSLFVKNKKTSSVYAVFSLSGGNRCNLPPETTILTTCNGLKVYWSTYKTSSDLICFSHVTRKWMSMEKHLSIHSFSFYGPCILEREHWRQSKITVINHFELLCKGNNGQFA